MRQTLKYSRSHASQGRNDALAGPGDGRFLRLPDVRSVRYNHRKAGRILHDRTGRKGKCRSRQALTKKIVEFQKGTIGVKSEVGKGSAFTVVLPRSLEEVTA